MEDDELERLRRAYETLAEDETPADGCPDRATIWAAARAELGRAELVALLDHVHVCPSCHQAWRLARGFAAETTPVAEVVPLTAAYRPRRRAALLAAALAALVFGGGLLWRAQGPLLIGRPGVVRAPGVETPAGPASRTGDVLPRDDFELVWESVEGAEYRIEIMTETFDTVAVAGGLRQPRYRVPPARLASLRPGTRLVWRVTATLADGRERASPRYEVTVR